MKKCVALALSILFVMALLPAVQPHTASADTSGQCGDDLYWSFDESAGTLTITGRGDMWNYNYQNRSPWYDYRLKIQQVDLPSGLTSIGKEAFYMTTELSEIFIPDTVTRIGEFAFEQCRSLNNIIIPDGVTCIERGTFSYCWSLSSVEIGKYTTSIEADAFVNSGLSSIEIPSSVTSIGEDAFCGTDLTSIIIPNSVTSVGNGVFYDCWSLASAEIGNGVTGISNAMFGGCTELVSVTLSNSITRIEGNAFYECYKLSSIELPENLTFIGDGAFSNCYALTTVLLPRQVSSLGAKAYYSCDGITSISIPCSLVTIGESAFERCSSLKDVYYEGSKEQSERIDIGAENTYLLNATWHYNGAGPVEPDGQCGDDLFWSFDESTGTLTITGSGDMWDYGVYDPVSGGTEFAPWYDMGDQIYEVVLPNTITSIGSEAFYALYNLEEFLITDSVTRIGAGAFQQTDNLKAFYVSAGNTVFSSVDGVLLNYDKTVLIKYPEGKELQQYSVPSGVITIGQNAFAFSMPTSVIISDGVTSIEDSAFFYCAQLKSITIPLSVTHIGEYAFYPCERITDVYYEGDEEQKASIDIENQYNGNDSLLNATWHYNSAGPQQGDRYLEINETNFPDDIFRDWIVNNLEVSGDDETGYYMTDEQAMAVEEINCAGLGIISVQGIEYFPNLVYLDCGHVADEYGNVASHNDIEELDVSKNTALTLLCCSGNRLTSLDVSKNTALNSLSCESNQLTELDLSRNTALSRLDCNENQLTALDVSNNTALESLLCDSNQLTSLDVSRHPALFQLSCSNNQLNALDVSKNTALVTLMCDNNQLTSLDVSKNAELYQIICSYNQLTSMDLSRNTELHWLYCNNNQLTALDVSKNTALSSLRCDNNQLTALDLSKNTALESLICYRNQLPALDLGNNTELTYLNCHHNRLNTLNLGGVTSIIQLYCGDNQLTALDVSRNTGLIALYCHNNQLTALDVDSNPDLIKLRCYGNHLTMLNLGNNKAFEELNMEDQTVGNQLLLNDNGVYWYNLTDLVPHIYIMDNVTLQDDANVLDAATGEVTFPSAVESFTYLYATGQGDMDVTVDFAESQQDDRYLEINETNFPDDNFRNWIVNNLDVSGDAETGYYMTEEQAAAVTEILCGEQEIASLEGVSHFSGLEILEAYACGITTVDLSQNEKLVYLNLDDNQISTIDLSHNPALEDLRIDNNGLTELDVSKNTALQYLDCSDNELTALDVSKNTELISLYCGSNELTALDVSKNTALLELSCYQNQLTTLDISKNTALQFLDCYGNRLTSLDVSKNTALQFLDCGSNELTALDVSKNTALNDLSCFFNQLTTLDLSKNTALQFLDCGSNELTALDVSKNTALKQLYCYNNQLTALDVSKNTALNDLSCFFNQLTTLDLSKNTALVGLSCYENKLTMLDLGKNTLLEECLLSPQNINHQKLQKHNGVYTYDLTALMPIAYIANVTMADASNVLDSATGVVTFPDKVESFTYLYATGNGVMDVTVEFTGAIEIEGTVEWNAEDVKFKGNTPYVICNGSAQTPRFTVKNSADGSVVDPENYDYEYVENTAPGTGYVIVTFKGDYTGECQGWFKIYLLATTNTYVENVSNGIQIKWDPVEGAAGYVIYRRAWSSTTNGWTDFVRWYNVTGTSWIDGSDDSHKVYAGSRYQYGVKAYFARRTDPVSGATIGGNVGDNFNLGEVGPLRTTVRITTRKLVQVRPGSKQMTVKWEASKNFTGYQIKYATDANFTKNVKAIKIGDPTTYWTTIKSLQSNTTYYVCIRSYHEFGGMTYFGEWSNVLSCKVK